MDIEENVTHSSKFFNLSIEERRLYPRVECEFDAEAIVPAREALFRGQIRNISEGGCYIGTMATIRVKRGMEISLRFSILDNEFHITGEVMNVRPGSGFGLRFLHGNTPEALEMLHCLIMVLMQEDQSNGMDPAYE